MTQFLVSRNNSAPKYIAPEILKKEKYKKPADIFAFAITMYEIIGWCDAFPKEEFKYSWDIAEFVVNGKRPEKPSELSNSQFDIIQQSWCEKPNQRLQIEHIISLLESELMIVNISSFVDSSD